MDQSSKKEEILIELSIQGDHQAFKELVERNQYDVAQVVKGVLGNCQEAEDVGQEVFIRFYKSMSKFKGKSKLKTYLTRIAINLSIDEARKRQKKWGRTKDTDLNSVTAVSQDEFKATDDKELINKALDRLSLEQRSVVVLRLIQGYSTKETAELLKIPQGTVLSRLSRAQETLKEILIPLMA